MFLVPLQFHHKLVTESKKSNPSQTCDRNMRILVNKCLIQEMVEKGTLEELALFLYFKGKYSNSCFYNYTQESLASKTGVSRSYIRKHISFFLKNGWCRMHAGNLMFNKLSSIDFDNKKKLLVGIDVKRTRKEILEELSYEYLKHKAEQAKWYSNLCRDLKKVTPSESQRREKKIAKHVPGLRIVHKKSYGESGNDRFRLSIKKIAKWFKCSVGKAHGLIKSLCQRGFIDYCTIYISRKVKSSYEAKIRLMADKKSFFTNKGYWCRVLCNEYVFR